jgi:hypothetical protein
MSQTSSNECSAGAWTSRRRSVTPSTRGLATTLEALTPDASATAALAESELSDRQAAIPGEVSAVETWIALRPAAAGDCSRTSLDVDSNVLEEMNAIAEFSLARSGG